MSEALRRNQQARLRLKSKFSFCYHKWRTIGHFVAGLLGGAARATAADVLAFLVEGDHSPMVFLDGSSKRIQCFAQIACQAASDQGIAELSMTDHDLAQMTGTVSCF